MKKNISINPAKFIDYSENKADVCEMVIGQKVSHKTFGNGVIKDVSVTEGTSFVSSFTIEFENEVNSIAKGKTHTIKISPTVFDGDIITDMTIPPEMAQEMAIDEQRREQEKAALKRRKEEDDLSAMLEEYDVIDFWYITHVDNIPSIIKYGILSNHEVKQKKIKFEDVSDPDVQTIREEKKVNNIPLHDYVPLFFRNRNPMLYKLVSEPHGQDICLLSIKVAILLDKEFAIADGNAANRATKFYHSLNDLDKLPWDVLDAEYWTDFEDGKRQRNAEVLIHPNVPPEYIDIIYCNSDQTRKALAGIDREVVLDKSKFFLE